MGVYEKLKTVQHQLKAPKGQKNDFGGYKYRSCEDIVEAVKPLLYSNQLVLTLTDEVVEMGSRYYVKATAKIHDTDSKENLVTTAFAREEENKKGQDSAQVTGAASSYARKYALNGLFAIDDTKDPVKLLEYFLGINTEDIPYNSIVREFVGGSIFPV